MIAKLAVSSNHATLPNCDGCGRFTSNPDVKSWCEGQGDWHACYERLLCPKCAEKERTMSDVSKTNELIAEARSTLCRDHYTAKEAKSLALQLADALEAAEKEIERIDYHRGHWKDEFEALEAATRVPVHGEPNDDREAMLRRIESFDYGSDRVSDDLEQDIRELVALSRPTVPDASTERERRIETRPHSGGGSLVIYEDAVDFARAALAAADAHLPSVEQVQAEAWKEGYVSGFLKAMGGELDGFEEEKK